MPKLEYTTEVSPLQVLGFNKNILADEGYDFYTRDVNGLEITVSLIGEGVINVCLHNDGVSIPLLTCNTFVKLAMFIMSIEDNTTDLRHSIRSRRQELGLSAQSVADKAKTTQSNVLNFENGKANITLATLERICGVLGLEVKMEVKNV